MDHGGRVQSLDFFRRRLLSIRSREGLGEFIGAYKKDSHDLRASIANLMWYMRGSVSREEAWTLSYIERMDYEKLIEDRKKAVEKTGLALL